LYLLATAIILLLVCPPVNSQIEIRTEDHSCEGTNGSDTPACESAWQPNISAVFLGLVTNGEEEGVPIILNGEKAMTSRLHAIFKVVEAFRGVSVGTTTVISGGDLCGFPFSKGHRYLVYGRLLSKVKSSVSISSSTKWEKEASDDLKYLRGLPTAPRGATIHGSVFRYTTPENPASKAKAIRGGIPASGQSQRIEVRGAGQVYEAFVDNHGNFGLVGLPPGRYEVMLNADGSVDSRSHKSTLVEIADKGCARFTFCIDPFAKPESNR